jgi:hypothetical protein
MVIANLTTVEGKHEIRSGVEAAVISGRTIYVIAPLQLRTRKLQNVPIMVFSSRP